MISINDTQLNELRTLCPDVEVIQEGGMTYIYIPKLKLPVGCEPSEVEALLRPEPGPDGYTTRLFFSHSFPAKGQNWAPHRILDKTWHTFSFNNVPCDLRLIEIVANHLQVLR